VCHRIDTLLAEGRHSRGVLVAEQAGGVAGDAAFASGRRQAEQSASLLTRRPRVSLASSHSGGFGTREVLADGPGSSPGYASTDRS
jgi:hypothetical protein